LQIPRNSSISIPAGFRTRHLPKTESEAFPLELAVL
jgi:hypothetical protein